MTSTYYDALDIPENINLLECKNKKFVNYYRYTSYFVGAMTTICFNYLSVARLHCCWRFKTFDSLQESFWVSGWIIPHNFFREAAIDRINVLLESATGFRFDFLYFLKSTGSHKETPSGRIVWQNLETQFFILLEKRFFLHLTLLYCATTCFNILDGASCNNGSRAGR